MCRPFVKPSRHMSRPAVGVNFLSLVSTGWRHWAEMGNPSHRTDQEMGPAHRRS